MSHFVYIIQRFNGHFYVGASSDGARRLAEHQQKWKDYSARVVCSECFETRSEARRRKRQIKGWSRAKKQALIARDKGLLKKLAHKQP